MADGLYFQYGSYKHDVGEVTLSNISQRVEFSENDAPETVTKTMTVDGTIIGSVSEITNKIYGLEKAYSKQFKDAIMMLQDGSSVTATPHALWNGFAVGGVRVVGFSYPDGSNSEYATKRRYQINLEAKYRLNPDGSIMTRIPFGLSQIEEKDAKELGSYTETLSFSGGGPTIVAHTTLSGPVIMQRVSNQTPYRATQSGSSTASTYYPKAPNPMWSNYYDQPASSVTTSASNKKFTTSWSYQFISDKPLNGRPRAYA